MLVVKHLKRILLIILRGAKNIRFSGKGNFEFLCSCNNNTSTTNNSNTNNNNNNNNNNSI